MPPPDIPIIVIAGPTGSGKSATALELAQRIGGEIVNYDSVQLYRGFDIGSAKPTAEERRVVPHHLYDVADPDEHVTAVDWARRAEKTIAAIRSRGRRPILAGGTFFYLRALLFGLPEMPGRDPALRSRIRTILDRRRGAHHLRRMLERVDPASAARIAVADRNRLERAIEVWLLAGRPISSYRVSSEPAVESIGIRLEIPRDELVERLDRRAESMYDAGLIDETRALLARYPEGGRAFESIGYREARGVIDGRITESEAIAETRRRTRAYAKRQVTWLRSERGMHSVNAAAPDSTVRAIIDIINRNT